MVSKKIAETSFEDISKKIAETSGDLSKKKVLEWKDDISKKIAETSFEDISKKIAETSGDISKKIDTVVRQRSKSADDSGELLVENVTGTLGLSYKKIPELSSQSSELVSYKKIPESSSQSSELEPSSQSSELVTDNPRILKIVSSTSWTPDEDFTWLFNNLETIARNLPTDLRMVIFITGKGELKEKFETEYKEKKKTFEHKLRVLFLWLPLNLYP